MEGLIIGSKEGENLAQVDQVGLLVGTGDQNDIKIDETIGKTIENPIHEPLERLSRVPQTKRHSKELEEAEGGNNGGLGNIGGVHRNLMVTFEQV